MDREKEVSSTKFKELAEAMLCRNEHNCDSKPWNNRVNKMADKWQTMFEDHVERAKMEQSIAHQLPESMSMREDLQGAKVVESKIKVCFP